MLGHCVVKAWKKSISKSEMIYVFLLLFKCDFNAQDSFKIIGYYVFALSSLLSVAH